MNNLLQNYKIILEKLTATCSHIESFSQIRQPNKTFRSLDCNQLNPTEFSKLKRRKRKQIETLFAQLDGQFSMNVNFAKTFGGLAIRIISKITALTMIQYLNLFVFNRPVNLIKCTTGYINPFLCFSPRIFNMLSVIFSRSQ
jgi:hypothetical protein